jgi:hypothetical protein
MTNTLTKCSPIMPHAHSYSYGARIKITSSVCLSVRKNQLEKDFYKTRYWGVLLKFADTFEFWLKFDNNNRHFI